MDRMEGEEKCCYQAFEFSEKFRRKLVKKHRHQTVENDVDEVVSRRIQAVYQEIQPE